MQTAAAIIIGEEILSGKIQDSNTPLLVKALRGAGASLRRIACIGDQPEAIAEEVRMCAGRFDVVVTSGGIGPTHDDRTIEGVALAFDLQVVRHPDLEAMVRRFWADRCNDAALRLADVPEGGRLLHGADGLMPLVAVRNVFILPGVPRFFAAKLQTVVGELSGTPPVVAGLYLSADESSIASILAQVDLESPGVAIGSYPRLDERDFKVWVSVEGRESSAVDRAVARLLELLPPEQVVRVER